MLWKRTDIKTFMLSGMFACLTLSYYVKFTKFNLVKPRGIVGLPYLSHGRWEALTDLFALVLVIDALIVGLDMLVTKTQNTKKKLKPRIFFLTNASTAVDTDSLESVTDHMKKIGAQLDVL